MWDKNATSDDRSQVTFGPGLLLDPDLDTDSPISGGEVSRRLIAYLAPISGTEHRQRYSSWTISYSGEASDSLLSYFR